jgi:hypothetical protein
VPAAGSTDYSTYAAKVMRSCDNGRGPDGMLFSLSNAQQDAAFIRTLRSLGWKGQAETAVYDPSSLNSPEVASGLDGSVTYFDDVALPGGADTPVLAQVKRALAGIGDGSTPVTEGLLQGWIVADMAVQALDAAGPNPSIASVQAALKQWTYLGISGLTPKVSFPDGRNYPTPCANVMKVVGSQYEQMFPLGCGQVIDAKTGTVVKGGFGA